jgi:hypothetical protein
LRPSRSDYTSPRWSMAPRASAPKRRLGPTRMRTCRSHFRRQAPRPKAVIRSFAVMPTARCRSPSGDHAVAADRLRLRRLIPLKSSLPDLALPSSIMQNSLKGFCERCWILRYRFSLTHMCPTSRWTGLRPCSGHVELPIRRVGKGARRGLGLTALEGGHGRAKSAPFAYDAPAVQA